MEINAYNLPEAFFSPSVTAVNKVAVRQTEGIEEMKVKEREFDTIHNLSNSWALLPIEERNKIRKEIHRTNIKRISKDRIGKTMEWLSSLMCVVMAAILLSLFLRWLL